MKINIVPLKNDKVIYLAKSVRKNGKVKTVNIQKIGKLSELSLIHDDPINYCKDLAKELSDKEKNESLELIIKIKQKEKIELNKQTSFNAGYLFLQKLYYQLKIDKTCNKILTKNKVQYDLNKILKDLIFSRILFPSSKLSTFELSKNYLEQPDYELHDIYRALDLLSNNIDLIQKEVYKNSASICKRNTNILYYDCTNFYFEIEEADGFREYGVSKEHRPNPIVQMGLFMDGNGIPLAFNINPGNTNEQVTPIETEKMIEKEFGLSKFIYCSDAGLGSYNNKWFNQLKDRSFIVTQSLKKLKQHLLTWALSDEGWNDNKTISSLTDNEVIYKSKPILEEGIINLDGKKVKTTINQRLIVSYSPLYAAYQKNIREKQIERAMKLIKNPSLFNKHSSTDFKRFIKNIRFNKDGEIIKSNIYLDVELINQESQYDGFYALVTNLDDSDEEIVRINHNRWKIEESFRIMKLEFDSGTIYLQKENRIKAHFLTCYLALLIFRILEQKINTNDHYSTHEIIETLRHFDLVSLNDICFIPTFTRTCLTDQLEKISNLSLSNKGISNTNLTKIISSSKKEKIGYIF